MAAKEFLAKLILGSNVHKDLAIAEKEEHEAKGKYNNACQAFSVLEEKERLFKKSLDISKQEMFSLQSEKESIDILLLQLLDDAELDNAKTILEGRLDDKNILLKDLKEKLYSCQKKHELKLDELGKLKEEKTSLEHDVNNLSNEIELLKEKSKQREAKRLNVAQRKKIKEDLSTLNEVWQMKLEDFKARVDDDNLGSLKKLKLELIDYERSVKNAIEISVK